MIFDNMRFQSTQNASIPIYSRSIQGGITVVVYVVVQLQDKGEKKKKHRFFALTNTFGDTSFVFALTNLQWLDPDIWQTVDVYFLYDY